MSTEVLNLYKHPILSHSHTMLFHNFPVWLCHMAINVQNGNKQPFVCSFTFCSVLSLSAEQQTKEVSCTPTLALWLSFTSCLGKWVTLPWIKGLALILIVQNCSLVKGGRMQRCTSVACLQRQQTRNMWRSCRAQGRQQHGVPSDCSRSGNIPSKHVSLSH